MFLSEKKTPCVLFESWVVGLQSAKRKEKTTNNTILQGSSLRQINNAKSLQEASESDQVHLVPPFPSQRYRNREDYGESS